MHSLGKLSLGALLVCLGGCIVTWGYDDFDADGNGGSPSMGGSGGMTTTGGAGGVGGGSLGGAGGGGPVCTTIVCDNLPEDCAGKACSSLTWAKRVGNATKQLATDVALDVTPMTPHVAIVGNYFNAPINFGDKDLTISQAEQGEGFVAYLGINGDPIWTTSTELFGGMALRKANTVEVDQNNRVIVGGSLLWNTIHSGYVASLVTGVPPVTLGAIHRFGQAVSSPFAKTEVIDIAVDGLDTYVLGSVTEGGNINCPGSPAPVELGFFVAKLDNALKCTWLRNIKGISTFPIAIAARSAFLNGVWITGTFDSDLSIPGTPMDKVLTATPGKLDMFLLKFNEVGDFLGSQQLGEQEGQTGFIEPLDMDVDSGGWVYVVGEVTGDTILDENLATNMYPAAFVAGFDSSAVVAWKYVYPTGSQFQDTARMTSVAVVDSKLMVAGTFSGKIVIPDGSSNAAVTAMGNNPFVAKFNISTGLFDYFDYFPGFGEGFPSRNIHLAARAGAFAIGGAWIQSVDFSTPGNSNGLLSAAMNAMEVDIIAARFDAP